MGLTNEQIQTIKKEAAKYLYHNRPPIEIRDELDLGFRIDGQSVFVFEIRPKFMVPNEKTELKVAKTTFVQSANHWKVFWLRGDLKWYPYEPCPHVPSISAFFDLIQEDSLSCFFG